MARWLDWLFALLARIGSGMERVALTRPAVTVTVGVLLAVVSGLGLTRIQFANDYRVFFAPDDPQRVAQEQLERAYTAGDTVTLVITAQSGDLFTRERLALLARTTDALARLPHVLRVESLTNHAATRSGPEGLVVAPLLPSDGAIDPASIRSLALADAMLVNRLVSRDGKSAQVIATVALPANDTAALTALADQVQQLKQRITASHGDLQISASGVVLLSHAFYDISRTDMMKLVPLMCLILLGGIALFFRSLVAALAGLFVLAMSVVATMGLAAWLGYSLSPASAQTPIIILTIATAETIHLIAVMKGRTRQERLDAARKSLRVNHLPIFVTAFTDILGFITFNFSDTPPFRDLGNIACIGVVVAYFYSVMLLPALLTVLPLKANTKLSDSETHFEVVAKWCMAHRGKLLMLFAAVSIGLGSLIPRLPIRDNFLDWLAPGQAFRVDAERANKALPGLYTMQFSLPAPKGVSDPDYLRHLDAFSLWLRDRDEVAHVWALPDLMKRLNRAMHGDAASEAKLPQSADLAAQYLLLYELSLTDAGDLTAMVTLDKHASRVVVALNDISSESMMAFKRQSEAWLRTNAPASAAPATGTALMFATLTEDNSASMALGTIASFALIAAALAVALRSMRLGLVSLLPSIVPAVLAFGAWYFLSGSIGLYAAFVISCALGLVIDATTHFLLDYGQAARRIGHYGNEAVLAAFRHIGMDLWVASVVLMLGFGVLCFSDFAIIANLAKMVVLIFLFGTATTFLMLPALLSLVDQPRRSPRAVTGSAAAGAAASAVQ